MTWPFKGITVTVLVPTEDSTDPFGAPVAGKPDQVEVTNVLVSSPSTEAIEQTTRQFGAACELTLNFPKTFTDPLRGCSVELPAPWEGVYEVLGEPMPLMPGLCPDERNRDVHVRRAVG